MDSITKWKLSSSGEYVQWDSRLYPFDIVRLCNLHEAKSREAHRIMLAAPELLAALEAVLAYEDDRPAAGTRGAEVFAQAEAAIARARGSAVGR